MPGVLNRFRPETERLLVQLPTGASPAGLVAEIERLGAGIETMGIAQEADRRRVELDVKLPRPGLDHEIVLALADLENVLEVRWTED